MLERRSAQRRGTVRRSVLGETGLEVSALGLGGHEYRWLHAGNIVDGRHVRFNPVRAEVVSRARELGINYFDTTLREEVQSLGHVLAEIGGRDDIVINGMIVDVLRRSQEMTPDESEEFIRDELETRLRLLGGPFDIFMLGAIDYGYERQRAADAVEVYQRHREDGKFRYLGVSCHAYDVLTDLLRMDLPVDVVMFPYNYARSREPNNGLPGLLDAAAERNLGMVAMKPLCWTMYGIPFTAINAEWHHIQELIRHSFAWQSSRGAVHTSVVGVETVEELENDVAGVRGECNESLLAPYLESKDRLEVLVRNGLRHSKEVQARIVELCRAKLGRDLGEGLNAYRDAFS